MGTYAAGSTHHNIEFGASGVVRVGKRILNAIAERASGAADRSQFAALPAKYLDDVGMTAAERAAALGYEEPTTDGWRVVASHL
ncbi:MAG TPA: hypothetical protein VJY34_27690 [Roseiarcus sp.]|nr:hypothetical protein [Roseiarcus sp.]